MSRPVSETVRMACHSCQAGAMGRRRPALKRIPPLAPASDRRVARATRVGNSKTVFRSEPLGGGRKVEIVQANSLCQAGTTPGGGLRYPRNPPLVPA